MNALIIANSYVTKMLVDSFTFLIGERVEKIYVLSENNKSTDFDANYRVVLCDNVIEAVSCCEIILLIYDSGFAKDNLLQLRSIAKEKRKKYLEIINPWEQRDYSQNLNPEILKSRRCPVILIISCGEQSQIYRTEMELCNFFYQYNVKLRQVFTNESRLFLDSLSDKGLLNKYINSAMHCSEDNAELLVYAYNSKIHDYSESSFMEAFFINRLAPDYIIIAVDNEFSDVIDYSNFNKYFTSRCNCMINNIVSSGFNTSMVGQRQPVHFFEKKQLLINERTTSLNFNEVIGDIVSKISLPDYVSVVNRD